MTIGSGFEEVTHDGRSLDQWDRLRVSLKRTLATAESALGDLSSEVRSLNLGSVSSLTPTAAARGRRDDVDATSAAGNARTHSRLAERLLQEARELSGQLQQLSGGSVGGAGTTRLLQVERLESIGRSLEAELRRLNTALDNHEQRARLFIGTTTALSRRQGSAEAEDQSLLQQEQSGIHTSLRVLDESLAQASETRWNLASQKARLTKTAARISQFSQHLPTLNSVLGSIRRTRHRNTCFLALTAALCIVFTLWYMLT